MFFFFEDSAVPSFEQMIIPVAKALHELGGSAKLKDLDSKTIEIMGLSKEIIEIPHTGTKNRSEVSYRLAWARTHLKKYGLIKNTTRGVWSFTNKMPENIDDLDANIIVQSVRREGAQSSAEIPIMTGMETALAFEQFVISVIKDVVHKQDKAYHLAYSDAFEFGYDIILPQGIDSIDNEIYCLIKYNREGNKNYSSIVNSTIRIAENIKTGTILLIIGGTVSRNERASIESKVFNETGINTVIWDGRDLTARSDPESDYANYLINPKQALINSAIQSDTSDKKKENTKTELIERIKAAYLHDDLTLFLGAGVSIDAGIPLWTSLIKNLMIHMIYSKTQGRKLDKKSIEALNELAYSNKEDSPITQMRYIRSAFTNEEYYKLVHNVLYAGKINSKTKLLNIIARVCKPQRAYNGIKSIVTYNFDDLIEQNFSHKEIDFNSVYRDMDMPSLDKLNSDVSTY